MVRRRVVRKRNNTKRGTSLPTTQKSMFFPPTYKRYADIVRTDNPHAAKGSVNILLHEFRTAETRAKKRRIKWIANLAANRAAAARKKKQLSERERREYAEVERIYRDAVKKMPLPPKRSK